MLNCLLRKHTNLSTSFWGPRTSTSFCNDATLLLRSPTRSIVAKTTDVSGPSTTNHVPHKLISAARCRPPQQSTKTSALVALDLKKFVASVEMMTQLQGISLKPNHEEIPWPDGIGSHGEHLALLAHLDHGGHQVRWGKQLCFSTIFPPATVTISKI